MRGRRRDPQDLLSLGEAALEDVSAAAVLHDALLERFGDRYASIVQQAQGDADAFQENIDVRVDLDILGQLVRGRLPRSFPPARRASSGTPEGWSTRTVVTFISRPRWRPRARVFFDGWRAWDAATGKTIAFRESVWPGGTIRRHIWRHPHASQRFSADDVDELDQALMRRVKTELARRWSTPDLRRWLQWNDPNGDYRRATRSELIEALMQNVEDNRETPTEMILASGRPW